MCIWGTYVLCIPNMKFPCLTLYGELCTDNNANASANDDANANDDGQGMITLGSLIDNPNEPER